ncbi:MAG: trigger factor [Myxococcota bacterium]
MSDQATAGSPIRVRTSERGSVVRELEVEVDVARVRRAFDRAYRDLAKRVRVRGFRPGKTPRSVLEKLYGASLAEQIEQTLVAETLGDAVQQAGLEVVSEPAIEAQPLVAGADFRYTARVEVKPEVHLPDTRGLPAQRPRVQVSDEDVESELEALRQRNAPLLEEPEGTVATSGHVLSVDFDGHIDGKPFAGSRGRGVEVELGSGRALPGFEEQLVGTAAHEEREVGIRFPADYGNRELADKQAVFAVRVAEIKRRHVPALDDEFAKDMGEFDTLEALRARIRADLTALRDRDAKVALRRSVVDALIERTPFEVPPGLIGRELERQLTSARNRLAGSVPEAALEAQVSRWRDEWRERAEREVREALLLEAVAESEGIAVDDAAVSARLEEMGRAEGLDPRRLREASRDESLAAALRAQLRDERALDFLAAQAKVEEATDT